VRLPLGMNSL